MIKNETYLPLFSSVVDDEARSEEGREEVEEEEGREEEEEIGMRGERENGIADVTVSRKSATLSFPLDNTETPAAETEMEFPTPLRLDVEVEVGKAERDWVVSIGIEVEEEVVVGIEVVAEVVAGISLLVAFFTNPKIRK
jgi:hypothetical protein